MYYMKTPGRNLNTKGINIDGWHLKASDLRCNFTRRKVSMLSMKSPTRRMSGCVTVHVGP